MVTGPKDEMRREMLARREMHHTQGGHIHCISIMDRFIRSKEFDSAKCMLLYASKGGEVHTDGIILSVLSLGKRVCLPLTIKETHQLEIYEIKGMDELSPGAYGILEPKQVLERRVSPDEVDVVVVPGVSFDGEGHRLGYGMGYYDSLLKHVPGTKIGLAYTWQVVAHVPSEPHDVSVDMIVTENGVIYCGGKSAAAAGGKEQSAGEKEFRVVVLASGRGSDFQSIIDAIKDGKVHAKLVGLITDNPEAAAIERAKKAGVPTFVIDYKTREELDDKIFTRLIHLEPDLVVLAGYMKIIKSPALLSHYRGSIINIHPSLLPKYPGAHAQSDAFEAGEKVSGYTIHFVDASLDGGKVVYQEKVDISGCKTAEEASAKILEREHVGLPLVVERFVRGSIEGDT
jgi:phosphoribosylglycinamide formyltransferase-1